MVYLLGDHEGRYGRCGSRQTQAESEELLAIWRARNKEMPRFTYAEVSEMLTSGDFSRIPGFDEDSRKILAECMTAFVHDVDRDDKDAG